MEDREIDLVVARNLYAMHSKAIGGELAPKWRQVSSEDKKLWMNMARRARNKLKEFAAGELGSVAV